MPKLIITIIAIIASTNIAHAQSWIPPIQVPYIPVQKAQPITSQDYQQIKEQVDAEHNRDVANCSARLSSVYMSFPAYPSTIADGWHKVSSTDELTRCGESVVYTQGGKVVRWFDGINERTIDAATVCSKGRAVVKVEGILSSCYFLDSILDPASHTTEPKSGSINFYTNFTKLRGAIDIYVDGL